MVITTEPFALLQPLANVTVPFIWRSAPTFLGKVASHSTFASFGPGCANAVEDIRSDTATVSKLDRRTPDFLMLNLKCNKG